MFEDLNVFQLIYYIYDMDIDIHIELINIYKRSIVLGELV